MYYIRNATLALSRTTHGLITSPELDASYDKARADTVPQSIDCLWQQILEREFPKTTLQEPSFKCSPLPMEASGARPALIVSADVNPDTWVLVAIGFQGINKETTEEKAVLEKQFVEFCKKEWANDLGTMELPFLYGLLVIGTLGKLVKYDKASGSLKECQVDKEFEWLDAKHEFWRRRINEAKKSIEEALSTIV